MNWNQRAYNHSDAGKAARAKYHRSAKGIAALVKKERRAALKNHGMTEDQYTALLLLQGGKCAICQQPEKRLRKGKLLPLAVDHDHQTQEIRGLLCHDCNTGIGLLKDSPFLVTRAGLYLSGAHHHVEGEKK